MTVAARLAGALAVGEAAASRSPKRPGAPPVAPAGSQKPAHGLGRAGRVGHPATTGPPRRRAAQASGRAGSEIRPACRRAHVETGPGPDAARCMRAVAGGPVAPSPLAEAPARPADSGGCDQPLHGGPAEPGLSWRPGPSASMRLESRSREAPLLLSVENNQLVKSSVPISNARSDFPKPLQSTFL